MKHTLSALFILFFGSIGLHAQHGDFLQIKVGGYSEQGGIPYYQFGDNEPFSLLGEVRSPFVTGLELRYAKNLFQVPFLAVDVEGGVMGSMANYTYFEFRTPDGEVYDDLRSTYASVGLTVAPAVEYRFREFKTQSTYFFTRLRAGVGIKLYEYYPVFQIENVDVDVRQQMESLAENSDEFDLRDAFFRAELSVGYHFNRSAVELGFVLGNGFYNAMEMPVGVTVGYGVFFE